MQDQYRIYVIRQGSKVRKIEAPNEELKSKQRALIGLYNGYASFYPGCTARHGHSVLDNAAPHQGSCILFKTDIRSFYPSVTLNHLLRNFDLDGRPEWIKEAREKVLTCLLSVNGELVLPTGAPTSPVLCNIAATDLDYTLANIASQFGYLYTRYIDDLTFSSRINEQSREFQYRVLEAIKDHGFTPHKNKTQWVLPDTDQKFAVTGIPLLTNRQTIGAPKEIRRICRARLDKIALNSLPLDKVTQGYLSYVRMIDQSAYMKLKDYHEKRKARYVNPSRPCSSPQ